MSATVAIGFLLGQQPSTASVLTEVIMQLRAAGAEVAVHLHRGPEPLPRVLHDADVVALRALGLPALGALGRLEDEGVRCCNSVAATARARDKVVAWESLRMSAVPVPRTHLVETWVDARRAASDGPVVIKAVCGSRGSGVLMAEPDGLPEDAPFAAPYLVQDRLDHPGPDRKVFVIGDQVSGVLRPWPPSSLADKLGRPFDPSAEEMAVATRAGAALGLEVYGVDLVPTPEGPVVVDINAFPGFKGVQGAPGALAAHLLARARGRDGR